MATPYAENPFRVLGLTATDEVPASGPLSDPIPLPGVPEASRSEEQVARALKELGDPESRARHASHWFRMETELDEQALDQMRQRNWEAAYDTWSRAAHRQNPGSAHNLAIFTDAVAKGTPPEDRDFWEWHARALQASVRRSEQDPGDPQQVRTQEAMVGELIRLAREGSESGGAGTIGKVLRIFDRAGLDGARIRELEREFLADEVDRLRFLCAQVRERLVEVMRVRPQNASEEIDAIDAQIEHEVTGALNWIQEAGLPSGRFVARARRDVTSLYRSLARAWASLAENPKNQRWALERALLLAPDSIRDEIALELEGVSEPAAASSAAPEVPPGIEVPPPTSRTFLGTGLALHHERAGVRGFQDVTQYLSVLWIPLIPLGRYRLYTGSDGRATRAFQIPFRERQMLLRVLMLVILGFAILHYFGQYLERGAWQDSDLELEAAALQAKVNVLLKRTQEAAGEVGEARRELASLENEMLALETELEQSPETAELLTPRIDELTERLYRQRRQVEELETVRQLELTRLQRLQEARRKLVR
ncbi:MAG: hypothetical protein HY319_00015 [Armatimonadetes bacterium]|nr:hypothetical protein [Armatimonadota bacterium]